MNIKSILLGSAASLAMMSGVHAADAIVAAAPEPLEYVRICDAYGAGYFYIPGSETCLKIGGMVRNDTRINTPYDPTEHFGTFNYTRAQLSFTSATDTEYGPLKTNTVLRFNYSEGVNTDASPLIANIQLGGFLIGRADSQYNDWIGYAGNVINDDVIGDGPYELNQASYLYDSGTGFSAVVSLEDSFSSSIFDHYAPDAVAGIGFTSGGWGIKVVGGYDSIVKEGAIKARVDGTLGGISLFLEGAWNTDGTKVNKFANGDLTGSTGDWTVWGGGTVALNDKLKWNVQLAYADNKTFEATTNLAFYPVKGFKIQPEVTYVNYDKIDKSGWSGVLRFQRDF